MENAKGPKTGLAIPIGVLPTWCDDPQVKVILIVLLLKRTINPSQTISTYFQICIQPAEILEFLIRTRPSPAKAFA